MVASPAGISRRGARALGGVLLPFLQWAHTRAGHAGVLTRSKARNPCVSGSSRFGLSVARKRMRPYSVTPIRGGNCATVDMLGRWRIVQIDRHGVGPPHVRTALSDDDGTTYSEQKSGRRVRPIASAISRPGCASRRVRRAFNSASVAAPEQPTRDYWRCPCTFPFSGSCCLR